MIKNIVLLIALASLITAQQKCIDAQKGVYISYETMSKQDTISNLFQTINSRIPMFNNTYTNDSTTYTITDMHPQMYYNQHHQKQSYLDDFHVNVTLGSIELAFKLTYNIKTDGQEKKGSGRGRVQVDENVGFFKKLLIKDGFLEWDPINMTTITVSNLLSFDYSDPKLQYDDKMHLELMLNDHVGSDKMKEQIVNTFNAQYLTLLKDHLNNEKIIGTNNITYTYQGMSMNFLNVVKKVNLGNVLNSKGLLATFFFQLQQNTTECTPDTISFDQKNYGGLQEIYSISTMYNAFYYALQKGLFNVVIDETWQAQSFQFYMGDLANFVREAENYPPSDKFDVTCQWESSEKPQVRYYDRVSMYAGAPIMCTAKYNSQPIISVTFDLNLFVSVVAEDDSFLFVIKQATVFQPEWKSIDQKFSITNQAIGRFYISEVVKTMNAQRVFGTDFPTIKRKFPAVTFTKDYMIVFDPSEI